MKVLCFLESTLALLNDPDTPKDEYMLEVIKRDAEHYSQPFKPELITGLFEGWELALPHHKLWKDYTNNKFLISIRHDNNLISYYISSLNNWLFRPPNTLDDFITDCQRAGIELEWRKQ